MLVVPFLFACYNARFSAQILLSNKRKAPKEGAEMNLYTLLYPTLMNLIKNHKVYAYCYHVHNLIKYR